MSDPGYRTFILEDGRKARVPEASMEAWMQRMDDRGVRFKTEGYGEDAAAAPAPAVAAPAPAPPAPAPEPDPFEVLAGLGGMEPGGGRDYQDPSIQSAQMASAGPSLWESAKLLGPALMPGSGIAANALNGAASSAAVSALESDKLTSDPELAAMEALSAAGVGGLGGLLGGALTSGISKVASAAAPHFQQFARKAHAAVEGLTGPTFRNIAKMHGIDETRDGLVQAAMDSAPAHVIPQTTDWYRVQRGAQRDAAAQGVGDAVSALQSEVPAAISLDEFTSAMDNKAAPYLASTVDEERAMGHGLEGLRDNVVDKYGGRRPYAAGGDEGEVPAVYLSPADLQTEKVSWAHRGYPPNSTMSTSDADRAAMYRDAAGVPRQLLTEAAALATPETQALVRDAFERYGIADTLADSTARKVTMDESRAGGGLWDSLTSPVRDRMPDALSIGWQAAARGARGTAEWASHSHAGQWAGSQAGQIQSDAAFNPQRAIENAKHERERISRRSMGHNLKDVVEQALDENPAALGKYAPKLQDAYMSGDPMAMSAALAELERDHEWRIRVLPQLQDATNQTGDY